MNALSRDYSVLQLDDEIALGASDILRPWILQSPGPPLGGEDEELPTGECKIRIGNRPVVIDFQRGILEVLRERIASTLGVTVANASALPQALYSADSALLSATEKLRSYWNYYLVFYGIGVEDYKTLSELRFSVEYEESDEIPVTIMDYWPRPRSLDLLNVAGEMVGTLSLDGKFSTDLLNDFPVVKSLQLPFGCSIAFGGKGNIVAKMSFSLAWPVIEAHGFAASLGSWTVKRSKELMSQQLFCHLVYTRSSVEELVANITVTGVFSRFWRTPTTATMKRSLRIQLNPAS